MSRVIKFRAWDNFTGKMICNHDPLIWNRIMPAISVQDRAEYQSYTVMQFTGLHDKNWVEIYEGDICKIVFDSDGLSEVMQVVYHSAGFLLEGHGFWSLDSRQISVEVIGNIHQTPELLA